MSGKERLTLQVHLEGAWRDAAQVEGDFSRGIGSPTAASYDTHYYFAHGNAAFHAGRPVRDHRALSVGYPIDLSHTRRGTWPPFMLDLLPQGVARERLVTLLGLDPRDKAVEFNLLLRSGGSPIGNIRVKEAWIAEQQRLQGNRVSGVTLEEIFADSEEFREMADRFALLASGSSGVQGEWPKILLAQAKDGLWYPDSIVKHEDARDHIIVKMSQAKFPEDIVILEAEALYLELAREFGLRVGRALTYRNGKLIIPRFDRRVEGDRVVCLGQESLVAATGVAAFGYVTTHEKYIETLCECCTEPRTEIIEYVLRDVLNRAMDDTDNHGRNTALQKRTDGWIGLTPRFDFAPMGIHPSMIRPSTTWSCLRDNNQDSRYRLICASVAELAGQETSEQLRQELASKAELVAALPELARSYGISEDVIRRAFRFAGQVASDLKKL